MIPLDRQLPVWHVAFLDGGSRVWWLRVLRRGFRHCLMFAPDGGPGRWLLLDPLFNGAYIRVVDDALIAALVAEVRARGGAILLARSEAAGPLRPRVFMSCVSVVAAVLGVPSRALTPWRLFRTLQARGALLVPGFDGHGSWAASSAAVGAVAAMMGRISSG